MGFTVTNKVPFQPITITITIDDEETLNLLHEVDNAADDRGAYVVEDVEATASDTNCVFIEEIYRAIYHGHSTNSG